MNKILPVFVMLAAFLMSMPQSCASEGEYLSEENIKIAEVILDTNELDILTDTQVLSVDKSEENKSLKEKLHDVYNLDVYRYDVPSYLFKEVLTKKYSDNAPIESTHVWGAYGADIGLEHTDNGELTNHYDFNAVNVGLDGKFKNNNADFRIMMGFPPRSHRNFTKTMFADVFVATNKIPHHRVQVGYYRPRIGMEGGNSTYTLPFLSRAQIARNFGTARKIGARIVGDYSLVEYDLGVYSSGTYFQDFFPGEEFTGWVNFKPLGKAGEKYGNLKIGAGIDAGHRTNNFCVTGAYIGYDYKRFMANVEWASANGYNGNAANSDVHKQANGLYATIGYMLTKKLQILARYDEFDPDKNVMRNKRREYSVGLNYFIKGQALRLMLNYIFCQNSGSENSHRIQLGTQILF